MPKNSKSSGSGDIKRHLRAQADVPEQAANLGVDLVGEVREMRREMLNMSAMLTKVVADLEDLAVICRSITAMEVNFTDVVTRVGDVEKRIDYLESSERELSANLLVTKVDLERVWEKLEDMENRSWWNNVRIVGIPEGAEGQDTVKFLDGPFPNLLDTAGHKLEIDRVHRVPAHRSTEGDNSVQISEKNHSIFLFTDFANSTREKRDRFKECKKLLH